MFHRPVCVKCQTEFRAEKDGIGLLDMAGYGPVKIWEADLYKCPKCGTEIVAGFAQQPTYEHHMDEFEGWLALKEEKSLVIRNY